jgi:hypothetical protein
VTVGYGTVGTVVAAAAQTLAVPYPTGITAGDALVLTRAAKSETTAFITPFGWTPLDDRTGGTGVLGNDTGQLRLARYWKQADGTETGNLTVDTTPATVDVQMGVICRYTKAAGATWSLAASGGSDSTTGTDWSVTAATNPGITAGDLLEVVLAWPTDATRTWTAEVLAATGATISGLMVPLTSGLTALGADMAVRAHLYQCTAGPATAAPVYTATVNSATNIAGPTSVVRLREVFTSSSGPVAATLPPVSTAAAGTARTTATVPNTLPRLTATAAGTARTGGPAAATLPRLTTAAAGAVRTAGPVAAGLPAVAVAAAGTARTTGTGAGGLPPVDVDLAGQVSTPGADTYTPGVLTPGGATAALAAAGTAAQLAASTTTPARLTAGGT